MLSTKSAPSNRTGFAAGRSGCDWGLPVGWQQDAQVVPIRHGRQARERVGEPGFGVVAMALGAFQHREQDGCSLAGGFRARKEPILFADGDRTNAVFGKVVVDLDFPTIPIKCQAIPEGKGVVYGAAKRAARPVCGN
jgi:hypothetical protein